MWLGGGVQGGQLRRQRGGVGGDRGLGGERHGGLVDRLGGGLVGGGHRRGWGRGRRGRDVRGLGVVKRWRGKVGLRGGLVKTLGRGRGRGRRGVVPDVKIKCEWKIEPFAYSLIAHLTSAWYPFSSALYVTICTLPSGSATLYSPEVA